MFSLIHKEGRSLLLVSFLIFSALCVSSFYWFPVLFWPLVVVCTVLFLLFLQFFRNPPRHVQATDAGVVLAPADGKVVVIEEALETEYFQEKRLMVSIFMSPVNVHVNRNPVSGSVPYFRYHPGKYLVAWHPKSSTENERTTVVYDTGSAQILMRQIAGALAKRIKWYIGEGDRVVQGADMGFIKFGSRVDLYLPLDAKIEVSLQQKVKGNRTVIARL